MTAGGDRHWQPDERLTAVVQDALQQAAMEAAKVPSPLQCALIGLRAAVAAGALIPAPGLSDLQQEE